MKLMISVESIRFPLTGIGRYSYELICHLNQLGLIEQISYFNGRAVVDQLPTEQAHDAQVKPSNQYRLKRWVQSSSVVSELYRQVLPWAQRRALKNHADFLYHGPNFYLPPSGGLKVATFHDLSPFTFADCQLPARVNYMQKELKKTLATADALITDSEFVRQELASYFNWPLERIFTVPLAASAEFYPRLSESTRLVLSHYGLQHGAYSLYVGTIEPRKNLITLLEAYSRLPMDVRKRWPLILAGYQGWNSQSIHQRIEQAEQEGWARYLGFTPAQDLPLLYAGARLFVFPSLYEGFGLPVLEAMSSGVPVVCSNSSSLPEVTADCALMTAPDDVVGFTDLIRKGLEDELWRVEAVKKGLEQARTFSWSDCAQQTYQVYQEVLQK
ncbi:MAG: glycosyltransferase family 4 protein [Thiotrichales bacterium]|nr:glycosyltransferase family 4 protein [Thiotrichales bacterium]